jgi:mono/diheme cytochrome c family protein
MRSSLHTWLVAGLTWTAAAGAYLALDTRGPDASVDTPVLSATLIRHGGEFYAARCASCHGVSLEGEAGWPARKADGSASAPPHDIRGHAWFHNDAELSEFARMCLAMNAEMTGGPDAPDASEEDIRSVIAYIKSRWPSEIQARQAERNRATAPPVGS